MLLKKMNEISGLRYWFYRVNLHKSIRFTIDRDHSIEEILLVDIDDEKPSFRHEVKNLCFMENITIDDGELLNVDALLDLAGREDADA